MLTAKQERFVQGLVKGMSQREAYKSAYDASRMMDKTIDNRAYNLFKKSEIKARYEELMAEVSKEVVYDVAAIRQLIIDTELAILRADVASDDVDGRAVKNKRWDTKDRVVYEHYDKQEAIKVLREMLDINPEQGNNINIHLCNAEGYDD